MLCVVIVKPRGPHHWATCSGSVQASQTASTGASYTRMMSDLVRFIFCGHSVLLLSLFFFAVTVFRYASEAIEALFPELPVLLHPVGDALERFGIELARAPLRLARLGDQPGLLQHLQVLGDRGQAHLVQKRPGQIRNIRLALP